MNSFDKTKYQGHLKLTPDRRRGVVAIESVRRNGKTLRTALQAPTAASAHSLLVIGLTTSLRVWPHYRTVNRIREKLSILVTVDDKTFVPAINALMTKDTVQIAATPLRAGKHLLIPLAKQLARYKVTFQTVDRDDDEDKEAGGFKALRAWSQSHVRDPKLSRVPALYEPVASTELVWF